MLSIVIPALEAADHLAETLDGLTAFAGAMEVVVADGGSTDGTAALARDRGAKVIIAPRGRGSQLAAGAAGARGDWLLFLHADTRPMSGWAGAVAEFMARDDGTHAAVFRFQLDDASPAARRIERGVALRCRVLGLPYGDQGLLISRRLYDALGGFRPLALFEDVDMTRRIGRRRLSFLDVGAVTSAARYRRGGYFLRPLRNLACLALYFAGFPPGWVGKLYG